MSLFLDRVRESSEGKKVQSCNMNDAQRFRFFIDLQYEMHHFFVPIKNKTALKLSLISASM